MPDDEDSLVRDANNTSVCAECGGIFGDVLSGYVQECSCSRRTSRAPRWPGYDFNVALELCRGCTAAVIPSGSRWHVFFCRPCMKRVRAENERRGRTGYIPIGRHSVHHGISWRPEGPPASAVARQLTFLGSLIDELMRIHRQRARAVIVPAKALSLPTPTFLDRAREMYRRDESIDALAIALGTRGG